MLLFKTLLTNYKSRFMKIIRITTNLSWWNQYLASDTGLSYDRYADGSISLSYHNDEDLLTIGRDFGIWCVRNSVVGIEGIIT